MTTVNVASFDLRIPGINDIPLNSGSVSGLAFSTLYYVFYDDPGFAGGTVAFQVTTVKATALNGAGRVFVGSIRTPADGAPDTVGNDDGGAGIQSGLTDFLQMSSANVVATVGNATIANILSAVDGDQTTYTELVATGDGATNIAIADIAASPGLKRAYSSAVLKVWYSIPTNGFNDHTSTAVAYISWGTAGTGPVTNILVLVTDDGTTVPAVTLVSANLPIGLNLSQIIVEVDAASTSAVSGQIKLRIYDIRIDATV